MLSVHLKLMQYCKSTIIQLKKDFPMSLHSLIAHFFSVLNSSSSFIYPLLEVTETSFELMQLWMKLL